MVVAVLGVATACFVLGGTSARFLEWSS